MSASQQWIAHFVYETARGYTREDDVPLSLNFDESLAQKAVQVLMRRHPRDRWKGKREGEGWAFKYPAFTRGRLMTWYGTAKTAQNQFQFSPKFEDEISTRLEECNDDPNEPVTRNQIIREFMQDMDERDRTASLYVRELQDYGISIGIFKPYTKEQLNNVVQTGKNRRKYDFKRGDVYYVFDSWAPLGL